MAQATNEEIASLTNEQPDTTADASSGQDATQNVSTISQPGLPSSAAAANDTTESQSQSQAPGQNDASQSNDAVADANADNAGNAVKAANDAVDEVDEKSNDLPPKTAVTLTLKGTCEYNAFPYTKESDRFYFMASVKASYFKEKDRAPIDLCCVVDESSSMSGERIKLVKETVQFVLRNLTDQDRFGIVGYGSTAVTRLELTKMDEEGKKKAEAIVTAIRAQGMTALCEGLEYGVKMMRNRNKDDSNQIASVMLFTDGQANVGPTGAPAIQKKIEGGNSSNNLANRLLRSAPQQRPLSVVQDQTASTVSSTQTQQTTTGGNDEKTDEKSKDKTETNEGAIDTSLPCTIYTFGFGANHNEALLEALAEWGRGQYTFIENTDTIAEIFAECLGGLVSIVGRELKVKVSGLNDVLLNRCMSQGGYKVEETKSKQEFLISIPDIQSEENRDILFEITLPKLNEKRDNWPMAQISCEYQNVPKKKKEVLSVIGTINRCNETDEIGERNDELDAQCNRVAASEAMDIADKMAEKGDLTNARKVLSEAKERIQKSQTYKNQKKGYFKYAQNLVSEMDDVSKDLSDKQSYRSYGGKKLKMSKKAHAMQRSGHSSKYQSQSAYSNRSKAGMIRNFSKK